MIKDDPASLSKDIQPVYDESLEQQYYRVLGLNNVSKTQKETNTNQKAPDSTKVAKQVRFNAS